MSLYPELRAYLAGAFQNRNRSDLIDHINELTDDDIGEAQRLMTDYAEELLDEMVENS